MRTVKIDFNKLNQETIRKLLENGKNFEKIELIIEGKASSGKIIERIREFLINNQVSSVRVWVRKDDLRLHNNR